MSNVIGTPCPAQCGELVSPLGSRVREGGQDWHVHCYLKPKLEVEASRVAAIWSEALAKQKDECQARLAKLRAELTGKPAVATPTMVEVVRNVVTQKMDLPKADLQELLDRSVERARDPVLYDVVALGDSHPVQISKKKREGHSKPILVTFQNGWWTESDHGEVLTCSCGSPQCRLIDKLGLPRMVWSRRVQKIEDQDQRDELVRRLRK